MSVVAVVAAKTFSRRLDNKNFLRINGESLVEITVSFALTLSFVKKTILILDESRPDWVMGWANSIKDLEVVIRPRCLSDDKFTVAQVVQHLLSAEQGKELTAATSFLFLNCNIPYRNNKIYEYIYSSFWLGKHYDAVCSVSTVDARPARLLEIEPDDGVPVSGQYGSLLISGQTQSEASPLLYRPNGFFQLASKSNIAELGSYYGPNMYCFKIPGQLVVDIDEEIDLRLARALSKFLITEQKLFAEALCVDSNGD